MSKNSKFGNFTVRKDATGYVVQNGEWMDGPFTTREEAVEVAKEMAGATGGDVKTPAKVDPNTVKAIKEKAKKAPKEKAPKEPKVKTPKVREYVAGATPSPEEFFTENRKGKPVFVIGMDARLTQALKRVNAGVGTEHDRMLAESPVITNHPKVANSHHFQVLLGNEVKEGEEDAA
jgi:hypothetical protein